MAHTNRMVLTYNWITLHSWYPQIRWIAHHPWYLHSGWLVLR